MAKLNCDDPQRDADPVPVREAVLSSIVGRSDVLVRSGGGIDEMVAKLAAALALALDGAVEVEAGARRPFGLGDEFVRSMLLAHACGPEARAALELALAVAAPVGRGAPVPGGGGR